MPGVPALVRLEAVGGRARNGSLLGSLASRCHSRLRDLAAYRPALNRSASTPVGTDVPANTGRPNAKKGVDDHRRGCIVGCKLAGEREELNGDARRIGLNTAQIGSGVLGFWFARRNTFSRAGDLRESLLHVEALSGT